MRIYICFIRKQQLLFWPSCLYTPREKKKVVQKFYIRSLATNLSSLVRFKVQWCISFPANQPNWRCRGRDCRVFEVLFAATTWELQKCYFCRHQRCFSAAALVLTNCNVPWLQILLWSRQDLSSEYVLFSVIKFIQSVLFLFLRFKSCKINTSWIASIDFSWLEPLVHDGRIHMADSTEHCCCDAHFCNVENM